MKDWERKSISLFKAWHGSGRYSPGLPQFCTTLLILHVGGTVIARGSHDVIFVLILLLFITSLIKNKIKQLTKRLLLEETQMCMYRAKYQYHVKDERTRRHKKVNAQKKLAYRLGCAYNRGREPVNGL